MLLMKMFKLQYWENISNYHSYISWLMENIFSTITKDIMPLCCRELCLQIHRWNQELTCSRPISVPGIPYVSGPYLYFIHSDLDQCILKFYLSLIYMYPTLNPSGKYFWWQFCLLAKTRNCFDKSFVKWDK